MCIQIEQEKEAEREKEKQSQVASSEGLSEQSKRYALHPDLCHATGAPESEDLRKSDGIVVFCILLIDLLSLDLPSTYHIPPKCRNAGQLNLASMFSSSAFRRPYNSLVWLLCIR